MRLQSWFGYELYNYFRDYEPGTGRYVESDPIGLGGGLNTYGYVGGNPLSYTDPKGELKAVSGGASGGYGGGSTYGVSGVGVRWGPQKGIGPIIVPIVPMDGSDDAAQDDTTTDEPKQCENPCQGFPSRTGAYIQASEYAGLSEDWYPIGWDQYNKPSLSVDQKTYTEHRQRIGNDPYGYRSPKGGEVVEHPADSHHLCPHFHAKPSLGNSSIPFPYDPQK